MERMDRNKSADVGIGDMAGAKGKIANPGSAHEVRTQKSKMGDQNGGNLNDWGAFVENSVSGHVNLGTLYRFVNWVCENLYPENC
jgi:hypothetical protein